MNPNQLFFVFIQSVINGTNFVPSDNFSEYPSINIGDTNYHNTFVNNNISKHYYDRQLYGSMTIEDDVLNYDILDYG